MSTIKVLIVDDSAVVRQVLTAVLSEDAAIEIIGSAADPLFAMQKMSRQWPDVIVLDVEMPRMDGITFLKQLMSDHPTPVVICSSLTEKGAETSIQALAAGAVCIVTKPKLGLRQFLVDTSNDLIVAVKTAARSNVSQLLTKITPRSDAEQVIPNQNLAMARTSETFVAIGTSTGGTLALEYILTSLPRVSPGIVIVQHMPEKFTESFANRLDTLCAIKVSEAKSGDRIMQGRALIAPGGKHMKVRRNGAQYQVEILDGPPVNRHRPSVDVLFNSVAKHAGRNAVGVILTGMGDDGARGLKQMHDAGSHTIAQDQNSCVVYGMPKEAVKLGAADSILPLDRIPEAIMLKCAAG